MTNEQINLKIAESVGAVWKRQACSPWYPDDETGNVYFRRLYFISPDDIRGPALLPDAYGTEMVADDHPIPDYCNDLNAMHPLELALDFNMQLLYRDKLIMTCCEDGSTFWMAPAKQRAEAYLRAIGKWEEGGGK